MVSQSVAKDPSRFVICYAGIFYPSKDPYTFFRALRTYLDAGSAEKRSWISSHLRVQLIGSKDAATLRVVEALRLEPIVRFVERVPHDLAVSMLKASDMALIATGLGPQTRPGWLPSKLFEYLGCRVPILAVTPEGEAADIIRKTESGYVVSTENHAAIGDILDTAMNNKFEIEPKTGYRLTFSGVERYAEKNVMVNMIRILQSVVETGNHKPITQMPH